MTQRSVPVNPIVEALLEQEARGIFELTGYPGPCEGGSVRIYRDLGLQRYVEMSQDEVLHFSESEDSQDACRILFRSTANLTYVKRAQLSTSGSAIHSIAASADEVKRTARERVIPSTPRCTSSGPVVDIAARRLPPDDGPELPPQQCYLWAEAKLGRCLELGDWDPLWCWLEYYLDILVCIWGDDGVFI